jgi:hypothetical protein
LIRLILFEVLELDYKCGLSVKLVSLSSEFNAPVLVKSAEQLLRLDYLEYNTFVTDVDLLFLSLSLSIEIIFSGLALLLRYCYLIGDKSLTLIGEYSLFTS